MIVRETEQHFVMVKQHDHAALSGELAERFSAPYFIQPHYREDVLLGVYEHDRSWIRMDETPIWNDRARAPFSFMDYPLLPRLILYKQGIDEVELRNPYAALLCSLHYASFRLFLANDQPESTAFYRHELERQERIKRSQHSLDEEALHRHFQLLQLCDDFSLYICLNRPGAGKVDEHPWYRNGFKNADCITGKPDVPVIAHWVNEREVRIEPSPFKQSFSAKLKLKRVPKRLAAEAGIADAYKQTAGEEQEIVFLE